MLKKIQEKHLRKLVKSLENHKLLGCEHVITQVENIYNEMQDWEELHIQTQNKITGDYMTLIFDYFGLVNIVKNNQYFLTENNQFELLNNAPNFFDVSKTFTSIMLELYKKQYYHQCSLLYKSHINYCHNRITEYNNCINALQLSQISDEERYQKTMQILDNQAKYFEYKKIAEELKSHLDQSYSGSEKK